MQRYGDSVQAICIEKYFFEKMDKKIVLDEKSQEAYDFLAYGYY